MKTITELEAAKEAALAAYMAGNPDQPESQALCEAYVTAVMALTESQGASQ
jgi:hypothetical protein